MLLTGAKCQRLFGELPVGAPKIEVDLNTYASPAPSDQVSFHPKRTLGA